MHRQYTLMNDGSIKCSERPGVGASCTWEGWHPPFHLDVDYTFAKLSKTAGEGERIPPWYYGLTRIEDFGRIYVFHVIPFNFVIRVARWIEWMWAKLRLRKSYFDAQILEARTCGFEEGKAYERKFPLNEGSGEAMQAMQAGGDLEAYVSKNPPRTPRDVALVLYGMREGASLEKSINQNEFRC